MKTSHRMTIVLCVLLAVAQFAIGPVAAYDRYPAEEFEPTPGDDTYGGPGFKPIPIIIMTENVKTSEYDPAK